jgi:hypothetical protein
MGRKSWAVCGAWIRWARRGARTCMSVRHTGVVGSGRRCCAECCGTTGPVVRSARCSRRVTRGRSCIRAWAMSGSGRCSSLRRGGQSPHRSVARLTTFPMKRRGWGESAWGRSRAGSPPRSALGLSRPGRADGRSGHVHIAPIATDFCGAAKYRDVPTTAMHVCALVALSPSLFQVRAA